MAINTAMLLVISTYIIIVISTYIIIVISTYTGLFYIENTIVPFLDRREIYINGDNVTLHWRIEGGPRGPCPPPLKLVKV